MAERSIEDAVRALCLALPDALERLSHGMPNFHLRKGKTFAYLAINHHGDGRIALWLNVPAGMQDSLVSIEPKHCFVPPYVGPSGWLGVRLDSGLPWPRVSELVRIAYTQTAPVRGHGRVATPVVPPPSRKATLATADPMQTAAAKRVVAAMGQVCLALPESSQGLQFGMPVWRAGKRVFAQCFAYRDSPLSVAFWVGVDRQGLMTMDPRYRIPPYLGHRGWIALRVAGGFDRDELASLALQSYRHFALQRMRAALPEAGHGAKVP